MNDTNRSIPDLLLEQYRLGELDAERAAALEERMAGDAALRRRLEELDRSDREILDRYAPDRMAERITRRAVAEPARLRPLPVFGLSAAAAGVCALLVFALAGPDSGGLPGRGAVETEVVRAKGDQNARAPGLSVFRRTPSGPEALKDGATVFVRDTIQLRYDAGDRLFGVIVSIDGRGALTRHLPAAETTADNASATALGRGGISLPTSFELDDVPDFERFFFVTSLTPFEPAVVHEAARRLVRSGRPLESAALDLPAEFTQTSFLIVKEKR